MGCAMGPAVVSQCDRTVSKLWRWLHETDGERRQACETHTQTGISWLKEQHADGSPTLGQQPVAEPAAKLPTCQPTVVLDELSSAQADDVLNAIQQQLST